MIIYHHNNLISIIISAKKHFKSIQFIIFGSKTDIFEFDEFEETLQGNFKFSDLALAYKGRNIRQKVFIYLLNLIIFI